MISLSNLRGFRSGELSKLGVALNLINSALVSTKFQDMIRSAEFDNTNHTSEEVLANMLKPGTVSSISIKNLSWWRTHVYHTIAYENRDGSIVLNRYYFQDQSLPELANTILHEWLHACGYSHSSADDDHSVPYRAGNLLQKYLEEKEAALVS